MRAVKELDCSFPSLIKNEWFKYIILLDAVAIAIAMTNDYHQLFFYFNEGFLNSHMEYWGGVLEWPIKVFIMLQFILPVILLLKDAFTFGYYNAKMLAPVGVMVYSIAYHILYSCGVQPFRNTETVLVTCTSMVAFWYSAFASGLISLNEQYMELFYASGVHQKLSAARLRQILFMKLESIVAEERPKLMHGLELLKAEEPKANKRSVLQNMRLSASFIKKQCLLFLQGEIYGYVPSEDYQAALKEAWRYARAGGSFITLNINLEKISYATNLCLVTHNLISHAFMYALENDFEGLLVNVAGNEQRIEVSILAEHEYWEYLERLYIKIRQTIKYQGSYSFELRPTEDAVSLKLRFEVKQNEL